MILQLTGVIDSLPPLISPTGALVYGTVVALVILVVPSIADRLRNDDDGEDGLADPDDEPSGTEESESDIDLSKSLARAVGVDTDTDTGHADGDLDSNHEPDSDSVPDTDTVTVADPALDADTDAVVTPGPEPEPGSTPIEDGPARHRTLASADAITLEKRRALVGEQWTSTLRIAEFPDFPNDGYLSDLFELRDVELDLTAYIGMRNQELAQRELKSTSQDLQDSAQFSYGAHAEYLQERAAQAKETYKAVKRGERVFDQAIYVTVRGDTREELTQNLRKVRAILRDQPADAEPRTCVCNQTAALQSAAPLGPDTLERRHIVLGGGVGALLSSSHQPTILEKGGVEFGLHRDTGTPVVIDPFERENGYSMFTVADRGSGKSFASKQNFVRSIERSEDRIGVILEPKSNWVGVAEALGAKRITVGGDTGVNPLEIKPVPDHVRRARSDDVDFLDERVNRAIGFLVNFFEIRDLPYEERRRTLEKALYEAYRRRGITSDPDTFATESPTIQDDVFDVLEHMVDRPGEYITRRKEEAESIQADALWLLEQLAPFDEGGQLSNLGRQSDFEIRDEKVVYLDLAQHGGSMGGTTSLLMELMITIVYERAKETKKEVIFPIDESRYIMKDRETLEYLETIFRHHRHHDLSIRLITQTLDEFFSRDIAKMILENCSIKQFLRLEDLDEKFANKFGLNSAQAEYVRTMTAGSKERGYSESLIGIDGEWRGIEIHAMEKEQQIVDFEPEDQTLDELPGRGEPSISEAAREFRDRVEDRVSIDPEWQTPAQTVSADGKREGGGGSGSGSSGGDRDRDGDGDGDGAKKGTPDSQQPLSTLSTEEQERLVAVAKRGAFPQDNDTDGAEESPSDPPPDTTDGESAE